MQHAIDHLRPSARRRGISLIEVLISIFVISVGLLGIAALLPVAQHLANRGTDADRGAIAGHAAIGVFQAREMGNPTNWVFKTGGADTTPLAITGTKAYCLDPRGAAAGITAAFPSAGSMGRISLRSEVGNSSAAEMPQMLADSVFTLSDDLDFLINDDDTNPPAQKMEPSSQKRYAPGDFTWMATLVREKAGDKYTLSIIVFRRRDMSVSGTSSPVEVTSPCSILSSGIGGGDVKLTNANAAAVKTGEWIMLSDNAGRCRWYKIVYAADYDSANTARELTLAGRDWDGSSATATIIPNIVAVYERTIRLEQDTPWTR